MRNGHTTKVNGQWVKRALTIKSVVRTSSSLAVRIWRKRIETANRICRHNDPKPVLVLDASPLEIMRAENERLKNEHAAASV